MGKREMRSVWFIAAVAAYFATVLNAAFCVPLPVRQFLRSVFAEQIQGGIVEFRVYFHKAQYRGSESRRVRQSRIFAEVMETT